MSQFTPGGLTWRPDLPDPRDYMPEHEEVARLLRQLKPRRRFPAQVDWREYCEECDDQGNLGAGAAHACLGLLRCLLRRATGQVLAPSAMFVHQTSQRLMNGSGSIACELRTTWKTIIRFGVASEHFWPCDPGKIHEEPDAFVYASAQRFPGVCYVRLDPRGQSGEETLDRVKAFLASGFACVFGFSVCTSLSNGADIPFPTIFDAVRGGQAVMAAGYDDSRRIRSDRGALLVRASWGRGWGEQGCGWLPYAYVRERLACDFWTLLQPDWLASGEFQRPE